MDIVDALRVAGKPDGRTFEVMSRAAREIEHLREEVEFLRWKVANREFALRCGEERLSTATRLLREWVEYMDVTWDATPGLLQIMFDETRAFLNVDIPATEPLRLAAEVECPSCGAHVRFDPTRGAE